MAVSRAAVGATPRVRPASPAAARRDVRWVAGDQPLRVRPCCPPRTASAISSTVSSRCAAPARPRCAEATRFIATRRIAAWSRRAFYNADGDLLIVPEVGGLTLATEHGPLELVPGHIAVIPRGVVFSVLLHTKHARGYVAEAFGRHFRLPERGPIGANGLADPRHFRAPAAWYEERLAPDYRVVGKLGGHLHEASQDHSPFDVAGWHGNYAPWTYDLDAFSAVGNTRFDHGDPSVYTVLSAPLDEQGTHTLDFVVFPTRWDVTTNTFRPPFFHRNPIAEINGIVRESSPAGSPFQPGCVFITPSLTPHGVSGRAVERSRQVDATEADRPVALGGGLAVVPVRVRIAAGADAVGARANAARLGRDVGQSPELLPVTDAELELAFYEKFLFVEGHRAVSGPGAGVRAHLRRQERDGHRADGHRQDADGEGRAVSRVSTAASARSTRRRCAR